MPIGEVLRLLVEGTPFSLAIDPDATGTFRGELKRLTLREALTTLLTPLGLDFDVQGTIIRVMRHRIETRQFDLNLLNVQRGMQRTAANGDATATISTAVTADEVFAGIEKGVAVAAVGPGARAHRRARPDWRWSATFRSGWIASASMSRRCSRAARGRCGCRRACSKSRCATRRRSTGAWSARSSACRATPPTPASPPIRWRSETRSPRRERSAISGRPR